MVGLDQCLPRCGIRDKFGWHMKRKNIYIYTYNFNSYIIFTGYILFIASYSGVPFMITM